MVKLSKFLPTGGIKWIDLKEFEMNKYTCNSSKDCVFEVDLEYSEESRELHNGYPLTPDKIDINIKKEILSKYQLMIPYFYNIPMVLHYENLQLYVRIGIKLKKYVVF